MKAYASAQTILDVRDLHVAYGKVEALHGAGLNVGAGQIVTVIGPNGAGKSTMLNAIAGALPSSGTMRGSSIMQGDDIGGAAIEARVARGMCLVPEKRELFSSMSVEDNLRLGSYRRYKARDKHYGDQIEFVFDLFPRLKERRRQDAGTLSGGERQMLALGRALMAKPQLLLLDAPSLGHATLIDTDIRVIVARHEGAAANMAEADGKLTGSPGICFVTRGPGATHASVGVHTAMQDSTPMILFIGQVDRPFRSRRAFQDVE